MGRSDTTSVLTDSTSSKPSSPNVEYDQMDKHSPKPIDLKTAPESNNSVGWDNLAFKWNHLKSLGTGPGGVSNNTPPLQSLIYNNFDIKRSFLPSGIYGGAGGQPSNLSTFAPRLTTPQLTQQLQQPACPFSNYDISKKLSGCSASDWSAVIEQWQGMQKPFLVFCIIILFRWLYWLYYACIQKFICFVGNFYLNLFIISIQHARAQPPFTIFPRGTQDVILLSNWYQLLGLHFSTLGLVSSNALLSGSGQISGTCNDLALTSRYYKACF